MPGHGANLTTRQIFHEYDKVHVSLHLTKLAEYLKNMKTFIAHFILPKRLATQYTGGFLTQNQLINLNYYTNLTSFKMLRERDS